MRREYMIAYRDRRGWTLQDAAKKCKISRTLLGMLEASDQEVTHPKIAAQVAKVYKLNKAQMESMMPEHYRESSPNFEPDKYRRDDLDYEDFAVTRGWKGPKYM